MPLNTYWNLNSIPLAGTMTAAQGELKCKLSLQNPISTHANSMTKPTAQVKDAVRNVDHPLHMLWTSDSLVDRILAYIDETLKARLQNLDPPPVHALDCPGASLDIPGASFYSALAEVKTLEEYIRLRTPHPLVTIASVQDELKSQVIDLINALIKARYRNTTSNVPNMRNFENAEQANITPNEAEQMLFYPAWTRVSSDHLKGISYKSGFSDFGLFRSPSGKHEEQAAVVEGKPPWVYATKDLRDIYLGSPHIIRDVNNRFVQPDTWGNVHSGNLLLCQIWGELIFYGANIGFATNLDILFVFVRVNEKNPDGDRRRRGRNREPAAEEFDSGLVLSPLISWTDPRVHKLIQGLTFIALDETLWKASGRGLRDLLCPPHECNRILPQVGAGNEGVEEEDEQ